MSASLPLPLPTNNWKSTTIFPCDTHLFPTLQPLPLPTCVQSLDVIATRLFFDRPVPTKYPANVLSGFEPAAGATFFNLNELQVS